MDFDPTSVNLINFVRDGFQECLQSCTDYTAANKTTPCKGVAWDDGVPGFPQNDHMCWLKASIGTTHYDDPNFQTVVIAYVESN